VALDLKVFGPRVHERAGDWDSLRLDWTVGPIDPNYGKAFTGATFENADLDRGDFGLDTGEAEVEVVRLKDGQIINKH
jgi:hypothetical protein